MSRPYKRARPSTYGTVSAGALASSFNKKQAVAVARLSKRVRSLEREEELNWFDTGLAFSIDSTGEIPATGQLCLIPGGDDATTRVGQSVAVKSVQIRASATFNPGASATGNSSVVHIYLILDRQCNSAACAVLDVFTGTNLATALRNMSNMGRFKILHHWEHAFTSPAGATTAFCTVATAWEMYYKFKKDLILKFDSQSGAIGSIQTNNIFLMAGSDGNSDDLVSIVGNARLTYKD